MLPAEHLAFLPALAGMMLLDEHAPTLIGAIAGGLGQPGRAVKAGCESKRRRVDRVGRLLHAGTRCERAGIGLLSRSRRLNIGGQHCVPAFSGRSRRQEGSEKVGRLFLVTAGELPDRFESLDRLLRVPGPGRVRAGGRSSRHLPWLVGEADVHAACSGFRPMVAVGFPPNRGGISYKE